MPFFLHIEFELLVAFLTIIRGFITVYPGVLLEVPNILSGILTGVTFELVLVVGTFMFKEIVPVREILTTFWVATNMWLYLHMGFPVIS